MLDSLNDDRREDRADDRRGDAHAEKALPFLLLPLISGVRAVEYRPLILGITQMIDKRRIAAAIALACILPELALAQKQPVASQNLSGAIASGGTFQSLAGANPSRNGCLIENPTTATEPLYVNVGSASPTTANSFSLAAGAAFNCGAAGIVVTDALQVEAATSTHAFVALVQ
jgi:hypothetical protein